jgi:hypothetical protein
MAINQHPKVSYNSFQEFVNAKFDTLAPIIRNDWDTSFCGAGVYSKPDEFLNDVRTFGGALPRMEKFYKPAEVAMPAESTMYTYDVYGESFDIGLVNAGIPECWIAPVQAPATHKENLTIRIRHGVTGGCDAAQSTRQYAEIANLYTAACAKYRVRIILEWSQIVNDSQSFHTEIKICDYHEYLDPLTLVSMTSITMFRCMSVLGLSNEMVGRSAYSVSGPRSWLDQTEITRVGDTITIPRMTNNANWNLAKMLKIAGLIEEGV